MTQERQFLFKLSLELKIPIQELMDSMSYIDFLEYMEFSSTHPFQADRIEIQLATISEILYRTAGGTEASAIDFMITATDLQKQKNQEQIKQKELFEQMNDF